jgi:acyl-CoA synthetase (AMP-forming)/AMP-acid ligase II
VGVVRRDYKDPEETVKIIRKFILHTGDMAYQDEEGYYIFVGRMKHAIRRGRKYFFGTHRDEYQYL